MKFPIIEPLESRIAPAVLTLFLPPENPKNEGQGGGKTDFVFKVTLDAPATSVVTVVASTLDGTATVGDADFDLGSETLTFLVGETEKSFTVKVNGDGKLEGDETFGVRLSSPSLGSSISVGEVTATIKNDDAAPTLSIADARLVEGNSGTTQLALTVSLSNAATQDVTFDWATAADVGVNAAAAGVDFTAVGTTTVTILAGQTSATLNVPVSGDAVSEADETFLVNLSNAKMGATALTVARAQAKGTIGNDDRTLSIAAGTTVAEGDTGTTNANFTVTLDAAATYDVTATFTVAGFALAGGHAATVGTDFRVPTTLSVVIPAGQTGAVIAVSVVGDTGHEFEETFKVTLTGATNAALGAAESVGTITDADPLPTVSVVAAASIFENSLGDPAHPEIQKGHLNYTIRLNEVSAEDVTVLVSTANGTATTADGDYDAQSNVLVTIPAGTLLKTFTVKVNHDDKFEADESVSVVVSGPTGATLGTVTAAGTILNDDLRPTLSIGDFSKNEGNVGSTNFDFTVSLSNPSDQDITFNWVTAAGTATAGVDYTAVTTPTTVTIPAGLRTATLSVPVNGDAADEGDETFLAQISSVLMGGSPLVISDGSGTARIVNDEVTVVIAGAGSVAEGNTLTTDASFVVSLPNGAVTHDVVVTYAIQEGTAKSGTDFLPLTLNTVTILAGQTSATIVVKVKGDAITEGDESFNVVLTDATNAAIGTGTGAATITNDDALPTLRIADRQITEGDSGTKLLTFTVTASGVADRNMTFDWATALGSATAGTDYTAVATTSATIVAGFTETTVSVTLTGDTLYEADETFLVNLSNAMLGATALSFTDGQATGLIANDEANTLSVADQRISEGDAGTKTMEFTVSIPNAADQDITFDWGTALGSAAPGVDYVTVTTASGTILAGQKTTTVSVTLNGDTTDEADERFLVNLANAKYGATALGFARSQATGTIVNDEAIVSIAPAVTVAEGDTNTPPTPALNQAAFTLSLNAASTRDVVVSYQILGGTATAGTDYKLPTVFSATIPAGQTGVEVKVDIVGDRVFEGDETFQLNLISATNATVNPLQTGATATIANDDAQATLSVSDAFLTEGDFGVKNFTFTVSLFLPGTTTPVAASENVTFKWATENVSALSGSDYTIAGEQRTIFAGQTSVTLTVPVTGDTVDELDEIFHLNLSVATIGAAPIVVAKAQGIGKITNDERTVSILSETIAEGNTGDSPLKFIVSIPTVSDHDIIVHLEVQPGSTANAADYTIPAGLDVTIPAGQKSATLPVMVHGDTANEADETLILKIASVDHATLSPANTATGVVLNDDLAPTVKLLAPTTSSVAEGSVLAAKTDVIYRISLSAASAQDVTVFLSTLDGTATTADGDYDARSNVAVTIPAGTLEQTFTVKVNQDSKYELDETVKVRLNSATNATVSTLPAETEVTATIKNDDAVPKLSIGDVDLMEESGGGTRAFTFTISLDAASAVPVTFTATTEGGTAKAHTIAVAGVPASPGVPAVVAVAGVVRDYAGKTQTFTIPAGETTATFTVDVHSDSAFSQDEAFSVVLSGEVSATLLKSTGAATIRNDDALPTLSVADLPTQLEGDPAGATMTRDLEFIVTTVGAAEDDITFKINTADGTATAAQDYVAVVNVTGTIVGGSTTGKVIVTQNLDATDEVDESFAVNLSEAKVGLQNLVITDGQATVKLLNDDLTVSIENVTVTEGNSGETDAVFTVKLSAASPHAVTVHFQTSDGTATSSGLGADFTALPDTVLTFAIGETQKQITVKVRGDANHDITSNDFRVILSQPENVRIVNGTATGIITEDGDALPVITLVTTAPSLAENDGTQKFIFNVTLDHPSDEATEFFASTVDGTAKAGSDYVGLTLQRVVFAPGEVSKTIEVTVNNDAVFEGDETFALTLSDALRGTFATATATATITNDDLLPRLRVTGQQIVEGPAGEKFMSFTVQKIGAAEPLSAIDFTFATFTDAGDTALAGLDYEALSATYTIAANETSKVIQVKILGDAVYEDTETFSVQLRNATNARIEPVGDGVAKGMIVDDDLTVAFVPATHIIPEGNLGENDLVFTVSLSAVPTTAVTVDFAVNGITATAGADFTVPASSTLSFAIGQQAVEIRIPILGDITPELAETLSVTLFNPTVARLAGADTTATGTITNDDVALSISDGRRVEGDSGAANLEFTVTLDGASAYPVTVHYATQDGSGTAGSDYTTTAGDLTFALGETTKTFTVPILGDTTPEGDETFSVSLSNAKASNVPILQLLDGVGVGTITNDDSLLSITDVSIAEGESGTSTAIFTVTLSAASPAEVSVRLATEDGTAISTGAFADYVAKTETLTFAAGETTKTFSVTILGDRIFEPASELFKVKLRDVAGAAIAKAEGTGTITDAVDTAPTLSIGNATLTEGATGVTKQAEFTVTLSEVSGQDVTFDASTVAGTATAGTDFTALAAMAFTIPAGQKTFTISVPILGDDADEADELFQVSLSNAKITATNTTLTLADGLGDGKILNDDLSVTVGNGSRTEGNSGTTQLLIPVTLSAAPVGHSVTVNFTVTAGTATAGAGKDFLLPTTTSVTFAAGQQTANISIDILGDTTDENDETINVTLASATNAVLGAAPTAVGTILDDDNAPTLTIGSPTVVEGGSAAFVLTLSAASGKDVTVKWITVPILGGATSGADFTAFANAQTLVIPAGQTTGTINVPTQNDGTDELDETFQVKLLSDLQNATLSGSGVGTATILANDFSTFSISGGTKEEGNAGTSPLVFTVTRSGSTTLTSTVNFATVDQTATAAAGDFVAKNGTLTFLPGETSKTISVDINGDVISEVDESFSIRLSSPSSAILGAADATGTIRNDEVRYTIVDVNGASGPFSVTEDPTTGTQQFFEFKIKREGLLAVPGTVAYSTQVDDTPGSLKATAGTDYTASGSTVTFAAGVALSGVLRVAVKSDTVPEGDEAFKLKLTSSVNGIILPAESEAVVTITDAADRALLPQVKIEDAILAEGDSGTKELVFKVKLVAADGTTPAAAGGAITVKYSTADGTATVADNDYLPAAAGSAVVFAAGESEKEIRITLKGDAADEQDETFSVNLTEAKFTVPGETTPLDVTLFDASAIGTLTNDDLIVSLAGETASPEGNGDIIRHYTVSIPQASLHVVTVHVKTKDGTAISTAAGGALADFVALPDTVLTIPIGQTSVGFDVTVKGDVYSEANETFTLELSAPTGVILATPNTTVTLVNDDAAPTLNIGNVSIVEGDSGQANLIFTVTLAGGTREAVTLDFTTVEGSAKSSGPQVDYTKTSGTLTIPATPVGGTQQISVPILGDQWKELTETFTVQLSNAKLGTSATGVTFTTASATGTITDNGDVSLGVFVRDARTVEGGTLNFLVETTAPVTDTPLTFTATTRIGTAVAADFTTPSTSSFSIPVGSASTTVSVATVSDFAFEKAEFLHMDLKNFSSGAKPINGANGVVSARGIILDNDLKIISPREFQYVDEDGDLVDVKFSKGSVLFFGNLDTGRITLTPAGSVGGRNLTLIDLRDNAAAFAGTNITVTSKVQVLPNGERLGDGKTDVGAIEAAVPQADLFRFASGIPLGSVSISGDLGRISAGSILVPSGIANLTIGSLGAGTSIPAPTTGLNTANASLVLGPIGKMVVNGDIVGSLRLFGDGFNQAVAGSGFGKIRTLIVKGQLKGGGAPGSGQILFTAGIGTAIIGGITGGGGEQSGALLPLDGRYNTGIGKLTLLGDITGGAGAASGIVNANSIGKITFGKSGHGAVPAIQASLKGGGGQQSGSIIVNGGVRSLTINGDIQGGTGAGSGEVFVSATLGKTKITGSIIGGSSSAAGVSSILRSGFITAGNIRSVYIGGNIEAGENLGSTLIGSGGIYTTGKLGSLVVKGDVLGNVQNGKTTPVIISAIGGIGKATFHGDVAFAEILAGYAAPSSVADPRGTFASAEATIGTVKVLGDFRSSSIVAGVGAGSDGHFGTADDQGVRDNSIISRIAGVLLKSVSLDPASSPTASYGIVAEQVGSVKVNGIAVLLLPGAHNDSAKVLPETAKLTVFEV